MRNIYLVLLLLSVQFVSAQPYFARFYQFPDGTGNSIEDIRLSGDSILLRMNSLDEDPTTLKTRMVSMPVHSSQLNEDVYLPIVSPSNEWTVKHSELFLNSRRKYRFSPDTVLINGKYYYELTYNDSFLGAHSTGQFYREENGIVYTSAGEVVYDLNLGATDTLPSNQGANQGTRTVTAVGTTILNDNLPRKSMMVQCASDSITPPTAVVEGIGDLEDFFHSEVLCINPFDGQTDLIVCYSVNGQIIYMKPGENCDLTSTNAPGNWVQASVYPNPADERLYLDISSDAVGPNGQVSIYNSLGVCILNQKCAAASSLLSVDISGLHPGCYWGVVRSLDGKNFSFAFVRASR